MMKTGKWVNSSIGRQQLDNSGSAIGAARLNPANTFGSVSLLLKEYIDSGSEKAWNEIKLIIDRVYATISAALEALDAEVSFSEEVEKEVKTGRKLFFKPNLVALPLIDYRTHGLGIPGANTPWEFTAAVMRWFHDQRGFTYHQMSVGEAGMTTSAGSVLASSISGRSITREAVIEGKYGDQYGGWGFYFARQYLAECHDPRHLDDPLSGYQESLDGLCLPPGKAPDKLLVYDLNVLKESNSREVPVADGVNFKSITMHKAVVGGDPHNPPDVSAWPGCFLINLPKLKMHVSELFTCALKNLGMGLYGMEVNSTGEAGKYRWKYSVPNFNIPSFKMGVPHGRWVIETDEDTTLPLRDPEGHYLWKRTGGMEATIADAIQAVKGQKMKMLHVVDAIETTNINHSGPNGVVIQEGFVFASQDPVAVDACGARYLYSMVPLAEVDEIARKYKINSDVIQKIPMPGLDGKDIVTGQGYDSSFSRYHTLKHCEERGLGRQPFFVVGDDLWGGGKLASLKQHLGRVERGVFKELLTTTMYYAPNKPLLDFQAGILAYLDLNDQLTGSDYKRQIFAVYDENKDGVIDYLETGQGGSFATMAISMGLVSQKIAPAESMKLRYLISATQSKISRKEWNTEGHNFGEGMAAGQALTRVFALSQSKEEKPDPFFPGRTWGKGKWPSLQYVLELQLYARVFGQMFPDRFDLFMSPYGLAFNYADIKFNQGQYCNPQSIQKNEDVITNYYRAVARGEALLPFVVYVPPGMGEYRGLHLYNVEETDDPGLIFTASFNHEEVWRDLHLSHIY